MSRGETNGETRYAVKIGIEDKGAVGHRVVERTFLFYPLVQEQNAIKKATDEFLGRIFGGSVTNMISYLLKEEKLDQKELQSLRKMIQKKGENQ